MARLLRVVLLALLALVAVLGVGMFAPGRALATHGVVTVSAVRWSVSVPTRSWRGEVPRAVVYRDAVEADLDDDDLDERRERASLPAVTPTTRTERAPGRPARALVSEPPGATSRVAVGSGRLRGPPAV